MLKSADVRVGQVIHVNVVAHAGAVWSGVVRAEDLQFGSVAGGGERKRNQVGLGIMQLADFTALICASGVEVAETGRAQAVSPIVGFERILTEKFGSTIWIDRLARVVLRDRNLGRLAINGARGRKHEAADARVERGVQQAQRRLNVVAEIFTRVLDRLTDIGVGREVHDTIHTLEY